MYRGGSTYDLFDLWLGSGYIYQKIVANFNFDFSNEIFSKIWSMIFWLFFLLLHIYEKYINKFSFNEENIPINKIGQSFPSEDALTFFQCSYFSFVILQ